MKFYKTLTAIAVACACTMGAAAQGIDGYFRIRNNSAADGTYVEVRGPFTAAPDRTFDQALTSAGTVFHLTAVPDESHAGGLSYEITGLSCQGIEVVGTPITDYDQWFIDEIVNGDGNLVYNMVRQGFECGYTSVARATVGAVLTIVGSRLTNYGDATQEELEVVVRDFNQKVTANLDLGIQLMPVEGTNDQYSLFFDVPSLQIVSDWYLHGDDNGASIKTDFEKGMDAMHNYLEKNGLNLEIFTPEDITFLANHGYNLHSHFDDSHFHEAEGEVYFVTEFREIFANPDLLFNWLKLFMVKFTNEEYAPDMEIMGFNLKDIAAKMQEHYLTALLAEYLPRLRPEMRAYLISGRVVNGEGNVSTSGTSWTATNTLGFASEAEMAIAGDAGVWTVVPMDSESNTLMLATPHNALHYKDLDYDMEPLMQEIASTYDYSSVYYEFPVKAVTEGIEFYGLTEVTAPYVMEDGTQIYYNEIVSYSTTLPALTPALVRVPAGTAAVITVDAEAARLPEAQDPTPGGFVVDDDVVVGTQHAPARTIGEASNSGYFRGALLSTAIDDESMTNNLGTTYHPETAPVYSLGNKVQDEGTRLVFENNTSRLAANEAYIVPSTGATPSGYVMVGMPMQQADNTTGVENIAVPEAEDGVMYDLRGMRVTTPVSGSIYILNGRKIIVR